MQKATTDTKPAADHKALLWQKIIEASQKEQDSDEWLGKARNEAERRTRQHMVDAWREILAIRVAQYLDAQ